MTLNQLKRIIVCLPGKHENDYMVLKGAAHEKQKTQLILETLIRSDNVAGIPLQ